MERPRVHSSWALIQVEASFFINTKNKFGFFICQVHGFLSGLNYSLELQKKKACLQVYLQILPLDIPHIHSPVLFAVCALCPSELHLA